jgi:hypothetical protein
MVPILFEDGGTFYVGWQMQGVMPQLFDCEFAVASNLSAPEQQLSTSSVRQKTYTPNSIPGYNVSDRKKNPVPDHLVIVYLLLSGIFGFFASALIAGILAGKLGTNRPEEGFFYLGMILWVILAGIMFFALMRHRRNS